MAPPCSTVLLSSPIAVWRLPLLGVLLTGVGVLLLSTGVREMSWPALAAGSTRNSALAVATTPGEAVPAAPSGAVASRAWGGAWSGAAAVPAAHGRARGPAEGLGADLVAGRRAESAHLATVTLPRLLDCGDRRVDFMAMAALVHTGPTIEANLHETHVAADPRQAAGIDLASAALFGPPDRQPQAKLEEVLNRARARPRACLDEVATRLLAPYSRLILDAGTG